MTAWEVVLLTAATNVGCGVAGWLVLSWIKRRMIRRAFEEVCAKPVEPLDISTWAPCSRCGGTVYGRVVESGGIRTCGTCEKCGMKS